MNTPCWMLAAALSFSAALLGAELSGASDSEPGAVLSLAYQEMGYAMARSSLAVSVRSTAFSQEPELGEGGVHRGELIFPGQGGRLIQTSSATSNPGDASFPGQDGPRLGFIWAYQEGRLVLDLNRNGDMTDDPEGVVESQTGSDETRFQIFPGVRVNLPTDGGAYPMLLDLTLTGYGRVGVILGLRSCFAGKVTLGERDWQFGVVDRWTSSPGTLADSALLLRPWDQNERSFRVGSGTTEAFSFPNRLFFNGRAYEVRGEYDLAVEPPVCRLELREQPVPLGELEVAGQSVRRVVLQDGPWTAVVDQPDGKVPVPAGNYGAFMIELQAGDAAAVPQVWPADRGIARPTVIEAGRSTVLAAGGPLTNVVHVQVRRQQVVFQYGVAGASGDAYRLVQQDFGQAPRFTVYRAGEPIASGNFEFG